VGSREEMTRTNTRTLGRTLGQGVRHARPGGLSESPGLSDGQSFSIGCPTVRLLPREDCPRLDEQAVTGSRGLADERDSHRHLFAFPVDRATSRPADVLPSCPTPSPRPTAPVAASAGSPTQRAATDQPSSPAVRLMMGRVPQRRVPQRARTPRT
jgi:hypothetical protein